MALRYTTIIIPMWGHMAVVELRRVTHEVWVVVLHESWHRKLVDLPMSSSFHICRSVSG